MQSGNKTKVKMNLERPKLDDIERIKKILASENIFTYLPPEYRKLQDEKYLRVILGKPKSSKNRCILYDYGALRVVKTKIERNSTVTGQKYTKEDIVGIVLVSYDKYFKNTVNILIIMDELYRNRGIGEWAVKKTINKIESYDFFNYEEETQNGSEDLLSIARIQQIIVDGNISAMRVAEKVGLELEGVNKKALLIDGEHVDCYIYSHIPEKVIVPVEDIEVDEDDDIFEEDEEDNDITQPTTPAPVSTEANDISIAFEVLKDVESETNEILKKADYNNKTLKNINDSIKASIESKETTKDTTEELPQQTQQEQKQEQSTSTEEDDDIIDVTNEAEQDEDVIDDEDTIDIDEDEDDSTFSDLLNDMLQSVEEESNSIGEKELENISTDSELSESEHVITKPIIDAIEVDEITMEPEPPKQEQPKPPKPEQQPEPPKQEQQPEPPKPEPSKLEPPRPEPPRPEPPKLEQQPESPKPSEPPTQQAKESNQVNNEKTRATKVTLRGLSKNTIKRKK